MIEDFKIPKLEIEERPEVKVYWVGHTGDNREWISFEEAKILTPTTIVSYGRLVVDEEDYVVLVSTYERELLPNVSEVIVIAKPLIKKIVFLKEAGLYKHPLVEEGTQT